MKQFIKRCISFFLSCFPQETIKMEIVSLPPSQLLKGRKALITGGTSGIGKSIAEAFIKAGADVIITSRNRDNAERCALKLRENYDKGNKIYGVTLDTTDIDSFSSMLEEILSLPGIGKIDILVNNAGTNTGESYMCTEASYDAILDTNLKGYYFLSRQLCEYMANNQIGGNILNIASASSLRPAASPYVISKWGVRAITLGMAKKYIKNNIVVNGLAPGPTATPMLHCAEGDKMTLPNNPSKRYALPEEIANMAVILTSNMGRLIVGDIIYMTGGAGLVTYDDIEY